MSAQKEAQQPTRAQSLRWDIFKGIVAIILLILLILLLLRGCGTLGIGPVVPVPAPSEEATEAAGDASATPLSGSLGTPTASHAIPEILSPADGDQIASTTITLEGTGEAGSALDVLDGDEVIGSTVVGNDGHFSTELSPQLGDHVYTVRDTATDTVSSPVR